MPVIAVASVAFVGAIVALMYGSFLCGRELPEGFQVADETDCRSEHPLLYGRPV